MRMNRVFAVLFFMAVAAAAFAGGMQLRYDAPAEKWNEALPIGNGRMGAMIFGNPARERIQFNEDTLWIGGPKDYSHPGAAGALPEIRRLMFEGETGEAAKVIGERFLSLPKRQRPYQPFGDVYLDVFGEGEITNYKRTLDLERAVATVQYDRDGVHYTREFFASHPANVIVVRIGADTSGALNMAVELSSLLNKYDGWFTVAPDGGKLVLAGRMPTAGRYNNQFHETDNPLRFEAQARVIVEGGSVEPVVSSMTIKNADAVTILIAAHTSYVNFEDVSGDPHARCEADLAALGDFDFNKQMGAHIADHRSLFRRVSLELGETAPEIAASPANERIKDFENQDDPGLAEIYYQYGRYLLIASSRSGTQPANLQGVWNNLTDPSWECKYTTNINAEMNYWPAESGNLAECVEPFFDMLDELTISGARVARAHYGARGWVVHHNTDLWRGAAPINNSVDGCYPAGAAWVCQHLWQHYEYSGDLDFLANRAWPVMKGAAEFYLDTLVEDPRPGYHKWLVTCPSYSPEQGGLQVSPTMDNQIIREFFRNSIKASEALGVEAELREQMKAAVVRIPPNQIGDWGQIMEWLDPNPADNPTNVHRHISHLWGLYPGEDITPAEPEIFEAAKKSLAARGTSPVNQTGWAMGHRLPLWARALDGETAFVVLQGLIGAKTLPNMFNNGGGANGFQIDGNLGGAAGIAEMLLQSQSGEVALLPALPGAWPSGSFKGLRARGGLTVDCEWENGAVKTATFKASLGGPIRLRLPAGQCVKSIRSGLPPETSFTVNGDGTVTFEGKAGRTYKIVTLP